MVDMNSIPNAPVKIVFAIHFFLTIWGIQGSWSPDSYLFYNLLFFVTLLWSIHNKESPEPIEIGIFISVSSILLDIIVLIIYFPIYPTSSSNRFSAGMAILNLLIRPVTSMVLYRIHADRTGTSGAFPNNLGGIFGTSGGQRRPYEDIDSGVHQIVPGVHQPTSSPTMFDIGGVERDNKMPPPYHG